MDARQNPDQSTTIFKNVPGGERLWLWGDAWVILPGLVLFLRHQTVVIIFFLSFVCVCLVGTSVVMTHAIFLLYSCTEERKRHGEWLCLLTGNRVSSEGWERAFAVSGGWSHQEEDKTKGQSEPWIICCCHPTPSHNPPLGDSLFGSYVMSGRLWSALSILLPHYSNHARGLWPRLGLIWDNKRRPRRKGGPQPLVWTADACMLLQWDSHFRSVCWGLNHGGVMLSSHLWGLRMWYSLGSSGGGVMRTTPPTRVQTLILSGNADPLGAAWGEGHLPDAGFAHVHMNFLVLHRRIWNWTRVAQ